MFIDNKLEKLRDDLYQISVSTLNGTFFHEKTNSGFVQINRIEGNSVQNGTPTPDNPIEVKSFSGEVVTSGKNLYDLSKAYTKNGVLELIKNGFRCKGVSYIYYDIFIPSGWAFRLTWKKSNETLYNHCNVVFDNGSFGTAENGAGYGVNGRNVVGLHLAISNTTNENVDITDIILEVTKFGTEFPFDYYEPFHATKMEKLTLYGGMPNGINDTLERQPDGSYLLTQRYKEFVLDGSEEWNKKRSDSPAGKSVFHLANNPGVKYVLKGDNNSTPYGRNYLSSIGFATWADSEREGIGGWTGTDGDRDNTDIMINLKTSRLATDDIAGLKAWLKANPVTCVMELIQPIQRKVWLSPLSAYEGQTNIFANSEVGAEMEVEILTTNAVNEVIQSNNEYIFQERPNDNFIKNGDFLNLVNTTGKNEFIYENDKKRDVFDGWYFSGGNLNYAKVIAQDGGILLDSGTTENGMQITYKLSIEDSKFLSEKKVTLSREIINYENSASSCGIQIHKNGKYVYGLTPNLTGNEITYQLPKLNEGEYFCVALGSGTTLNAISKTLVKWIKLEIGERATPLEYTLKVQKQLETNGFYSLHGGNLLLQGTDLNNVTNIGNYYCNSDLLSTMIRNAPTQKAFTLKVESAVGETIVGLDQYPRQTITDTELNTFMRQGFINTAGEVSWKEWKMRNGSSNSIVWFPIKDVSPIPENAGKYVEETIPYGFDDLEKICLVCGWGQQTTTYPEHYYKNNFLKGFLMKSEQTYNAESHFGSETLLGSGLLELISRLPIGTETEIYRAINPNNSSDQTWITMNVLEVGADHIKLKYGFFTKRVYCSYNQSVLGYQPK